MTDSRRVVLVKPGDVLMIGNLDIAPEDVEAFEAALEPLREILGIPKILVFSDDIDLAVTSSTEASAGWSRTDLALADAVMPRQPVASAANDITHGRHYLREKYGQPGWYAMGTLPAGYRTVVNESGDPEPVTAPKDQPDA